MNISKLVSTIFLLISIDNSYTSQSQADNHFIKWITLETEYPIRLSVSLNKTDPDQEANWIKLSENIILNAEMENMDNYLVEESSSGSILFILNYNTKTHRDLSTYEPVMPNYVLEKRNLFTLAYMSSHSIEAKYFNDSVKVSCVADFYVSNKIDHELLSSISAQIKNFTIINIEINSPKLQNKDQLDYGEYFDLNQRKENYENDYIDSYWQSSKKRSSLRYFNSPSITNYYFKDIRSLTKSDNFFLNMKPISDRNFRDSNYFYHTANPSITEYMKLFPLDYPSNDFKPHKFNLPYDLIKANSDRKKRNVNVDQDFIDLEKDEEKEDLNNGNFDAAKFYKIRLNIDSYINDYRNRSLDQQEHDVSCTLSLINSHNYRKLDFRSTINKKIPKYMYLSKSSTKPNNVNIINETTKKPNSALEKIRKSGYLPKNYAIQNKSEFFNSYAILFGVFFYFIFYLTM